MIVQHLDVVAHQFLGGERVEPAANRIHRSRNLLGRALLGALEHHVLDEMRDPALVHRFFTRAGSDPDAYGNAAYPRHTLGNDPHSVREHGSRNVMEFLGTAPHWQASLLPLYRAPGAAAPVIH